MSVLRWALQALQWWTRQFMLALLGLGSLLWNALAVLLCRPLPLWRLPPLPIVFAVRLGRRFVPGEDYAAQLQELQAYFSAGVLPAAALP